MSDNLGKPRVRVPAGSSNAGGDKSFFSKDNFVNFAAQMGYGTQNLAASGQYSQRAISKNHFQLEIMYRSSWMVRQIVDSVAEDMTRAGLSIDSDMPPDDIDALMEYWRETSIWSRLNSTIKWSRLYGGCLAVIVIEGQAMDTPLITERIMKNSFRGLMVLDRWQVNPSLSDIVRDAGPDMGRPRFYDVIGSVQNIPSMKIHYTRIIRMDGIELPYWQSMSENGWGLSVIEPLMDRLVAFDSVTQGAAQLAYKAHLRVMKVEGLRNIIATGGMVYQAFLQQMGIIRMMQTNEGLTVIDAEDDFQVNSSTFAGLSDLILQFGQQLSGGATIPMTRLFGQSPAGMNATGESDMRNYYDGINSQQNSRLHRPVAILFDVTHRSKFGKPLPEGFSFSFNPLWQMTDAEKATIGGQVTTFVEQAHAAGLVSGSTALKELRQSSRVTGYWSNITDEDISEADQQDLLPDVPDPNDPNAPNAASPEPDKTPPDPNKQKDDKEIEDGLDTAVAVPYRRKRNHRVAMMFPNSKGLTHHHLPHYAQQEMTNKKHVAARYRNNVRGRSKKDVARMYTNHILYTAHDSQYPMRTVLGLDVVVESYKGNARGPWKTLLAADYGYIRGTGSAEGGTEQMDCFIGSNPDSEKVWIIKQNDPATGDFDEHKVMLGFDSLEDAKNAYIGSFDETGELRFGGITPMSVAALKEWLTNWTYTTNELEHEARSIE